MVVPLGTVIALMAVMALKHFCADFLFQTSGIAKGKAAPHGWVAPLALHAGGHALLTLLIALPLFPRLWWVAPVEFVIHFAIDRAKAVIGCRTALNPTMTRYWWLVGFDQFLHQITNVVIVLAFLAWGHPGG